MHTIVVDLGYGDAGKGTVTALLCEQPTALAATATAETTTRSTPRRTVRRPHAVVRFNGGAQAAHNVVTDDGRHHTFAQFGAGSFTPGTTTHLSRHVLVDPLALITEAEHLAEVGVPDALERLTVDRDALLTTPYHALLNQARERAREQHGTGRHGSTGRGIGETVRYALDHPELAPTAGDCAHPAVLHRKLTALREHLAAETAVLAPHGGRDQDGPHHPAPTPTVAACAEAFRAFAACVTLTGEGHLRRLLDSGPVVFEGSQGVLLDEWHGFHPYTSWSTSTFHNAEQLLAEAGRPGTALRLGVLRTTTPRHGPGPLVTEDPALELPEPHNTTGTWQGPFRQGHFDAVAHRYAAAVCGGVNALALTHLDALNTAQDLRIEHAYRLADNTLLTRLPFDGSTDLTRQQALTHRLLTARPDPSATQRPAADPQSWCEAVSAALDAPVVIGSAGPRTTRDKRLLPIARYATL